LSKPVSLNEIGHEWKMFPFKSQFRLVRNHCALICLKTIEDLSKKNYDDFTGGYQPKTGLWAYARKITKWMQKRGRTVGGSLTEEKYKEKLQKEWETQNAFKSDNSSSDDDDDDLFILITKVNEK